MVRTRSPVREAAGPACASSWGDRRRLPSARLLCRTHDSRRCGIGRRKGLTEADYARLLDAAHQQLGGASFDRHRVQPEPGRPALAEVGEHLGTAAGSRAEPPAHRTTPGPGAGRPCGAPHRRTRHRTAERLEPRRRRCSTTPACPPVPSPTSSVTPTRASPRTSTSVARSLPLAPRWRSKHSGPRCPPMRGTTVEADRHARSSFAPTEQPTHE